MSTVEIANLHNQSIDNSESRGKDVLAFLKSNYKYKRRFFVGREKSLPLLQMDVTATEVATTTALSVPINLKNCDDNAKNKNNIKRTSNIICFSKILIRLICAIILQLVAAFVLLTKKIMLSQMKQNANINDVNAVSDVGEVYRRSYDKVLSSYDRSAHCMRQYRFFHSLVNSNKCLQRGIPNRSNRLLCTNFNSSNGNRNRTNKTVLSMLTIFIAIALSTHSVNAGVCWQRAHQNGKCNKIFSSNMTKSECCKLSVEFAYTDRELTSVELFFVSAIGDGLECAPCIDNCRNVKCGLNKRCVKRKGHPKCVCAPQCGAANRHKNNNKRKQSKLIFGRPMVHASERFRNSARNVRSLSREILNTNLEYKAKKSEVLEEQQLPDRTDKENQRNLFKLPIEQQQQQQQQEETIKANRESKRGRLLIVSNVQPAEKSTTRRLQVLSNVRRHDSLDDRRYLFAFAAPIAGSSNNNDSTTLSRHNANTKHTINRHSRGKNKSRSKLKLSQNVQTEVNDSDNNTSTISTVLHDSNHGTEQSKYRHQSNHKRQQKSHSKDISTNEKLPFPPHSKSEAKIDSGSRLTSASLSASAQAITETTMPTAEKVTQTWTTTFNATISSSGIADDTAADADIVAAEHALLHRGSNIAMPMPKTTVMLPASSGSDEDSSNLVHSGKLNLLKFPTQESSTQVTKRLNSTRNKLHHEQQQAQQQQHNAGNPVCGTDGRTYNTECQLKKRACRTENQNLQVAYRGHCKTTCKGVKCLNEYTCVEDQNTVPHCIACKIECPQDDNRSSDVIDTQRAVCGVDGKTYKSICDIERMICKIGRSIAVAYPGPCRVDHVSCEDIFCGPKHTCLVDLLTHEPRCVSCRYKCSRKRRPDNQRFEEGKICGYNNHTYNSWCEMHKDSCNTGLFIDIKHTGECRLKI